MGGTSHGPRRRARTLRRFPRAPISKETNPSKQAAPRVVVAYKGGRFAFAVFLAATLALFGVTIYVTALGRFLGFVLCAAMTAVSAYQLTKQCHRIELWSDRSMVLHFFLRPNRITRATAVTEIKRDGEIGEFEVAYRGGKFTLRTNNSGKALVHALVKMNPRIVVKDYEIPKL